MLPSTVNRVPANTCEEINQWIQERTEENIAKYSRAGEEAIAQRLDELDEEWDIERTLEANASTISLAGLALGLTVNRRWLLLPGVVCGFLLQHALQGWCPPLPILRRLGFRTSSEIAYERYALKAMRGDFQGVATNGQTDVSRKARQALSIAES